MKLATYRDGSRDGQLVVVSRDLSVAHYATHAAHTLQQVLDDWNFVSPQLEDLYRELNHGKARHVFPFDPGQCLAPLPRTSQCVSVDAPKFTDPSQVPGLHALPGDAIWGPTTGMQLFDAADGLDFEAGWGAICGDIPVGCTPARALEGVRLVALTNTWVLRAWQAREQAAGKGQVQSRPGVTMGPVAVTTDELGDAWDGGRLSLGLAVHRNGQRVVCGPEPAQHPETPAPHVGHWLSQLAARRPLRAGVVVCVGQLGQPTTAGNALTSNTWLQAGDDVRVEWFASDGSSPLGAIDTEVWSQA